MNDPAQTLEPPVQEALRALNAPPPPPLEQMWRNIERGYFGATVHRFQAHRRWMPGLAVAAALLLGVLIGHFNPFTITQSTSDPAPMPSMLSPVAQTRHDMSLQPIDAAYNLTANRYLGETAALLAVLPGVARIEQEGMAQQVDAHFASQAADLVSTTRMLLDSPAVEHDKALQALLSDLELVLAQVASLSPMRTPEELKLITEAVRQRDVLSRVQAAVIRTADEEPLAVPGAAPIGRFEHSM